MGIGSVTIDAPFLPDGLLFGKLACFDAFLVVLLAAGRWVGHFGRSWNISAFRQRRRRRILILWLMNRLPLFFLFGLWPFFINVAGRRGRFDNYMILLAELLHGLTLKAV